MSPTGPTSLTSLEADFFRSLNRFVEPLVRAGLGAPLLTPSGLIVLETTGWRSGRVHRLPVLATIIEDHALVGSVRADRSHWVRNIRESSEVRYWLGGEVREASALVFDAGEGLPELAKGLPPLVRAIVSVYGALPAGPTVALAVLAPVPSDAVVT